MNVDKKKKCIYVITILLMIIPIIIVIIGPSYTTSTTVEVGHFFWKHEKEVQVTNYSPFQMGGLAAVYAVILYTILLIRNKNTLYDFNVEKINIMRIILHVLDLLFLVTICSLIPSEGKILFFDIDPRVFMFIAILLSLIGMKSISGYIWIIVSICLVGSLVKFDKWGPYAIVYIIFSYMSIVSQVLLLNIFDFNIDELMYDFNRAGKNIMQDVNQSIELTKETSAKIVDAAKPVAPAIKSVKNVKKENEKIEVKSKEKKTNGND